MFAINDSSFCNDQEDYCGKTIEGFETVIVTCKDEKNNAYLNMLDKTMEQLAKGEGKIHELI